LQRTPDPAAFAASENTPEEMGLLELLDLPPDTPIRRDGAPMPSVSQSVQRTVAPDIPDTPDVQPVRESMAAPSMTSRLASEDDTSDEQPSASDNRQEVEKMAEKVYRILQRRFRIDIQRERGR
jgi:hypothetical protein